MVWSKLFGYLQNQGWSKSWFLFRLFFFQLVLNWGIIASQCCAGFCHTMRVCHKDTSIPSVLSLPPTPPHPTLLGRHLSLSWAPCTVQQFPSSCLFSHVLYLCQYYSFNLPYRFLRPAGCSFFWEPLMSEPFCLLPSPGLGPFPNR